jgi:hypothetical protein
MRCGDDGRGRGRGCSGGHGTSGRGAIVCSGGEPVGVHDGAASVARGVRKELRTQMSGVRAGVGPQRFGVEPTHGGARRRERKRRRKQRIGGPRQRGGTQ